jgi:hypothetical protein
VAIIRRRPVTGLYSNLDDIEGLMSHFDKLSAAPMFNAMTRRGIFLQDPSSPARIVKVWPRVDMT